MKSKKAIIVIFIIILWLSGTFNFLTEIFPALISLKSFIYLFCDLIFLSIGIIIVIKNKLPKFILLPILLFIIVTIIATQNNGEGMLFYFNGIREFIPFFSSLLLAWWLFNSSYRFVFVQKMDRFFFYFLLLQIPCAFMQFFKYGASDWVGGSWGNGGSGLLTFSIFLITFYFFNRVSDDNSNRSKYYKYIYFLLWIPSFINETKISFLLIPLFFLFSMNIKLKSFIRNLFFIVLVIFGLIYFNSFYESILGRNPFEEFVDEDFLTDYLMSEDVYKYNDVPRFTKLTIGFNQLKNSWFDLFFGMGVGHFKGGTQMVLSEFAATNQWYLKGSVNYLFFLFIQSGILGVFIITYMMFSFLKKCFNKPNSKIGIFTFAFFLLIMTYNPALRDPVFSSMFSYVICYSVVNTSNKNINIKIV